MKDAKFIVKKCHVVITFQLTSIDGSHHSIASMSTICSLITITMFKRVLFNNNDNSFGHHKHQW